MRRVSAIGLALALCAQPGLAVAADDLVMRRPIARSLSREASRLAVERSGPAQNASWKAVRNLDPARPIVITTAAATVTRTFVAADDTTLTVLNLSKPGLSETSRRQLLALARAKPLALAGAADGSAKVFEAFRLAPDGVFLHDVKVAEPGELIERVPIGDVLTITASVRRGSAAAAVLGTLGGIWLGTAMALTFAYTRCQPNCAGVELGIWGSVIGVPAAGGYGAWRASSRLSEEVIYRRQITQSRLQGMNVG
jgi:hypothetical protein